MLINTLQQLQYSLVPTLCSTDFLYNKIVSSCQGHPACRIAVSDPPAILGELINKLQSAITTYEKEQQLQGSNTDTYYTDRRYRSDGQNKYKGQSNYKSHPSTRRPYSRDALYPCDASNCCRCFICKKEGCRSWKHTP